MPVVTSEKMKARMEDFMAFVKGMSTELSGKLEKQCEELSPQNKELSEKLQRQSEELAKNMKTECRIL